MRLVSRWRIDAPPEAVWDVLRDAGRWPEWWPGVEAVVLLRPARADGAGEVAWSRWRAPLGYPVRFEVTSTRVTRPAVLEGVARGDLEGRGVWHVEPAGRGASVTFTWDVVARRRLLRLAGPLARSGHHGLMRAGERGLRRRLAA